MVISKTTMVFCLVVFFLICSYSQHTRATTETDKKNIIDHCKGNMRKHLHDPFLHSTSVCCRVVRMCNVEAICNAFTSEELADISLARWAKVTHVCGNALRKGTNCAGMFLLVIS